MKKKRNNLPYRWAWCCKSAMAPGRQSLCWRGRRIRSCTAIVWSILAGRPCRGRTPSSIRSPPFPDGCTRRWNYPPDHLYQPPNRRIINQDKEEKVSPVSAVVSVTACHQIGPGSSPPTGILFFHFFIKKFKIKSTVFYDLLHWQFSCQRADF